MRKNRLDLPDFGDAKGLGVVEAFGLTPERADEISNLAAKAMEDNQNITDMLKQVDQLEFTENEWAFLCLGAGFVFKAFQDAQRQTALIEALMKAAAQTGENPFPDGSMN